MILTFWKYRVQSYRIAMISKLLKIFPVIVCFLILYISLIIVSPVILFLLFYRSILSLIHKGKYGLLRGSSATYISVEGPHNMNTITIVMYAKGSCDIQAIRNRMKGALLTRDTMGRRPYELLLNSVVEKHGFFWWEDKSDQIDFNHHVRYFPVAGAANDPRKIYTESEMLEAIASLADNPWPEGRPRWEIVVVRNLQREDDLEELYHGIVFKVCHAYGDGVSAMQLARNCIFDQPPPKLIFDPVNPPLPPVPIYLKFLTYLQAFFLGPYETMRVMGRRRDPVFGEGSLAEGKFYGRMKMRVSIEMMRRIRKFHKCSTQSVIHSGVIGAMRSMATRKGFRVPDEVISAITYARLPYPDERPRNNVLCGLELVKIGISDRIERLASVDAVMKTLTEKKYSLVSSQMLSDILGIFPKTIMAAACNTLRGTYLVSNVPGISEGAKVNGNVVSEIAGFSPLIHTFRYTLGVSLHNGNFIVGFVIGKTKVVNSRDDLETFVSEFEKELYKLDCTT